MSARVSQHPMTSFIACFMLLKILFFLLNPLVAASDGVTNLTKDGTVS
jgi:hypothetical protein